LVLREKSQQQAAMPNFRARPSVGDNRQVCIARTAVGAAQPEGRDIMANRITLETPKLHNQLTLEAQADSPKLGVCVPSRKVTIKVQYNDVNHKMNPALNGVGLFAGIKPSIAPEPFDSQYQNVWLTPVAGKPDQYEGELDVILTQKFAINNAPAQTLHGADVYVTDLPPWNVLDPSGHWDTQGAGRNNELRLPRSIEPQGDSACS
jgi:hypothetical protein